MQKRSTVSAQNPLGAWKKRSNRSYVSLIFGALIARIALYMLPAFVTTSAIAQVAPYVQETQAEAKKQKAQTEAQKQQSADDENSNAALAQKLANPIAALISVPFQFNYNGRIGPVDKGQTAYVNFQPVIPIKVNQDWNIISRTVAPLTWQTSIFPGAGTQTGLSNIQQSFFLSPVQPVGGLVVGAGPILYLPTATDKLLGTSETGAGPTAIALRIQGPWTYGILANQIWGFAGPVSYGAKPVNQVYMQPFVAYTTSTAWTFSLNSESQYDWNTQKWTMPFNFMVSKLVRFDKQPVSFQLGVRYYAASPQDGPKGFGARATVTFLFPD